MDCDRAPRPAAPPFLGTDDEQFRLMFEAAPIGMALVATDGSFVRVNPALCALVGYASEELMQRTFQDITNPEDLDLDLAHLQDCLDGTSDGYEMEKRYVHRDGHEVWVQLNVAAARDASGRATGFVSQILDIQDRRAAEASESRFTALVEHGSDLISVSDAAGRLLYASPAYRTVLGFDPDERRGQPLQDQIHPDDLQMVTEVGMGLMGEAGATATIDFRYAHADGTWRWVEATLTNRLDDPAVRGFVTNTRDITDRVLATERLAHRASHDTLTGLPNRSLLAERMVQVTAAATRRGEAVAALFVDIDHFKQVNDTHGHAVGDLVLTEVAHRLRQASRLEDSVFRLGGDEFVVLASVRDEAAATELAARVCRAFTTPFYVGERTIIATASVGVAAAGETTADVGLLEAADLALYDAKAVGRNGWVAYLPHMRNPDRSRAMGVEPDVTERYRSQVAASPQPIVVHMQGAIVAASPPAVEVLGAKDEGDLVGRSVFEFATPESLGVLGVRQQAVKETGSWPQPEVIDIVTLTGDIRRVELASLPVFWDGTLASQITLRPAVGEAPPAARAVDPDARLLDELADAIDAGQLRVAYQPIVDRDGHVVKVEALVRWQHPVRGLLAPGAFIPVVERSPLIGRMTAEILRQSTEQVAAWRRGGMPSLELAVNISGRELADPGLVDRVASALQRSGLPACAMWVEVTETALANEAQRAADGLSGLCALGVQVALDDFGTGFATLAQLHRFPGQALKIDQMFVDGLVGSTGGDAAIVRSVLALGRELGLAVIAEGVETQEQLDVLLHMGCELFQGYLFARPAFPDPAPVWVRDDRSAYATSGSECR